MAEPVFQIDPNVLGGTPCFTGTRVPVKSFIHHLKLGYDVNEFLADFPTVKRAQVDQLLTLIEHTLTALAAEHKEGPGSSDGGASKA